MNDLVQYSEIANQEFKVSGVDGCKGGWFVVRAKVKQQQSQERKAELVVEDFSVEPAFDKVLSVTSNCKMVCVDIPIGLTQTGPRACDNAARMALSGKRASSVFPAPVRACLAAVDYQNACDISFQCNGKKLSRQSFAIMNKIREVDDLMTPLLQNLIREIHPEVSFWAINQKKPLKYPKKECSGCIERLKFLCSVFTGIDDIIEEACSLKGAETDDILDALVAAYTATEAVRGNVKTLPENPTQDIKGLRMEIVYPDLL